MKKLVRVAKWIALGLVGVFILALALGVTYEQWARHSAAERFPPPGEMVIVDGVASHLYCTGTGSPTVVLESGLDLYGSQGWVNVQPEVAQFTRVCSYDRAGIARSAARDGPRDAVTIAAELRALLAAASESPPYVMVGHSLGGLLMRVFAEGFKEGEVVGFVFVDSSHPEQLERLPPETKEQAEADLLLTTTLATTGVMRILDRNEPGPPGLAQEAWDVIVEFAPQSCAGALDEIEAIDQTLEQAVGTGPYRALPLVVLTAGRRGIPGLRKDLQRELSETILMLQADLAALSTNSDHRMVNDAGHFIQWDNPEAVITAILDVVSAARESWPVRRAYEY